MTKLSRRKIAEAWADSLVAGRDIAPQVAAYLVEARRTREADLIVRDTEAALAARGIVIADVTSATDLSPESRRAIETFLTSVKSATRVTLRTTTDPQVIGGVRFDTAGERLDATLRGRLNQLKASKI